jgi:hypothetical protein
VVQSLVSTSWYVAARRIFLLLFGEFASAVLEAACLGGI